MGIEAIIVGIVILVAVILFATELLSVDLVAISIMTTLVLTGVISIEEGVAGFSHPATLTVAFMFVLSAALVKTGVLSMIAPGISRMFKRNLPLAVISLMLITGVISAFVNNTPVVAVFIPIIMSAARSTGIHASRLLMPLSFSAILGGSCTLIGSSTNLLVSGIAEQEGIGAFPMFKMSAFGLILLGVGVLYMAFVGLKFLPKKQEEKDLKRKFGADEYLTEIELLANASSVGKKIMDSPLVDELDMDIIEIRRNNSRFTLPPGDMKLKAGDVLKVQCNLEKIRMLKDRMNVSLSPPLKVADENLMGRNTTLVEMVITAHSEFEGKTLRQVDFRRKFRAIPLAIRHRQEVLHEQLHDVQLKAGDVILAEIKSHYVGTLKKQERERESPFIIISEETVPDFNRRNFAITSVVIATVIGTVSLGIVPVLVATLCGVVALVVTRCLDMKEMYEAIDWKIVFLLAGTLSLGVAMEKSGLAGNISDVLINQLGQIGPWAIVSGMYLVASILTSIMSNNATAALLAPIAIATAQSLELSPWPFLMAVTFASSASFMTPIGYQTNTMIYSAGQYRFIDFMRVGGPLNLLFWILATFLIPLIYPF